jgi:isopentenyldiphosphate isomerase
VLDSSGRPVGKMKPKSEVHRDGDWHGAAHLWILNREGRILIQRRSPTKENWPNLSGNSIHQSVSFRTDVSTTEPFIAHA